MGYTLVDGSLVVEEAFNANGSGAEGLVQYLECTSKGCVLGDVLPMKPCLPWYIVACPCKLAGPPSRETCTADVTHR